MAALLTLLCFVLSLGREIPAYGFAGSSVSAPEVKSGFGSASIIIPEALGRIEKQSTGSSGKTIVLIQDAHGVPSAQIKIRKLLGVLAQNNGIRLAGLEGAEGVLDARLLKNFPDQKKLIRVIKEYAERGEIPGGAASAIFNRRFMKYFGLEDLRLYEQALRLYARSLERQPEFLIKTEDAKVKLNSMKKETYSPDLWLLDQERELFYSEQSDLSRLISRLSQFLKPAEDSDLGVLLNEISKQEGASVNAETHLEVYAKQLKVFLSNLPKTALDPKQEKSFHSLYQDWKTSVIDAGAFSAALERVAHASGFTEGMPPEALKAAQSHKRLHAVQGSRLSEEIEAWMGRIEGILLKTPEEKLAAKKTRCLRLIESLIRLELSSAQWKELLGRVSDFDQEESSLWSSLTVQREFYETAYARDKKFLDSMKERMRREKTNQAALVAGGFHAQALFDEFTALGFSCILVMPKIQSLPKENFYQKHMQGDISWKNYFEVKNGRVNIHEAFVRAVRDKLVEPETGRSGDTANSPRRPLTVSPRLLKAWRDNIIRDLAATGDLARAWDYTRFLDELSASGGEKSFRLLWMTNIEKFIAGLRNLKAQERLSAENISALVPKIIPSATPDPTYSLLSPVLSLPLRSEMRQAGQPDDPAKSSAPASRDAVSGIINTKVPRRTALKLLWFLAQPHPLTQLTPPPAAPTHGLDPYTLLMTHALNYANAGPANRWGKFILPAHGKGDDSKKLLGVLERLLLGPRNILMSRMEGVLQKNGDDIKQILKIFEQNNWLPAVDASRGTGGITLLLDWRLIGLVGGLPLNRFESFSTAVGDLLFDYNGLATHLAVGLRFLGPSAVDVKDADELLKRMAAKMQQKMTEVESLISDLRKLKSYSLFDGMLMNRDEWKNYLEALQLEQTELREGLIGLKNLSHIEIQTPEKDWESANAIELKVFKSGKTQTIHVQLKGNSLKISRSLQALREAIFGQNSRIWIPAVFPKSQGESEGSILKILFDVGGGSIAAGDEKTELSQLLAPVWRGLRISPQKEETENGVKLRLTIDGQAREILLPKKIARLDSLADVNAKLSRIGADIPVVAVPKNHGLQYSLYFGGQASEFSYKDRAELAGFIFDSLLKAGVSVTLAPKVNRSEVRTPMKDQESSRRSEGQRKNLPRGFERAQTPVQGDQVILGGQRGKSLSHKTHFGFQMIDFDFNPIHAGFNSLNAGAYIGNIFLQAYHSLAKNSELAVKIFYQHPGLAFFGKLGTFFEFRHRIPPLTALLPRSLEGAQSFIKFLIKLSKVILGGNRGQDFHDEAHLDVQMIDFDFNAIQAGTHIGHVFLQVDHTLAKNPKLAVQVFQQYPGLSFFGELGALVNLFHIRTLIRNFKIGKRSLRSESPFVNIKNTQLLNGDSQNIIQERIWPREAQLQSRSESRGEDGAASNQILIKNFRGELLNLLRSFNEKLLKVKEIVDRVALAVERGDLSLEERGAAARELTAKREEINSIIQRIKANSKLPDGSLKIAQNNPGKKSSEGIMEFNQFFSLLKHNSGVDYWARIHIKNVIWVEQEMAEGPSENWEKGISIVSQRLQYDLNRNAVFIQILEKGTQTEVVDLIPIVRERWEMYQSHADQKGLALKLEISDEQDWTVTADVNLLKLVLDNLIENALKYTKQGNITIKVSKQVAEISGYARLGSGFILPSRNEVIVQIIDTGIGIPEREQRYVLRAGTRGSNVGSREGTGFGLSFVEFAVKSWPGADFQFESTEGQGSTFTIKFPEEGFGAEGAGGGSVSRSEFRVWVYKQAKRVRDFVKQALNFTRQGMILVWKSIRWFFSTNNRGSGTEAANSQGFNRRVFLGTGGAVNALEMVAAPKVVRVLTTAENLAFLKVFAALNNPLELLDTSSSRNRRFVTSPLAQALELVRPLITALPKDDTNRQLYETSLRRFLQPGDEDTQFKDLSAEQRKELELLFTDPQKYEIWIQTMEAIKIVNGVGRIPDPIQIYNDVIRQEGSFNREAFVNRLLGQYVSPVISQQYRSAGEELEKQGFSGAFQQFVGYAKEELEMYREAMLGKWVINSHPAFRRLNFNRKQLVDNYVKKVWDELVTVPEGVDGRLWHAYLDKLERWGSFVSNTRVRRSISNGKSTSEMDHELGGYRAIAKSMIDMHQRLKKDFPYLPDDAITSRFDPAAEKMGDALKPDQFNLEAVYQGIRKEIVNNVYGGKEPALAAAQTNETDKSNTDAGKANPEQPSASQNRKRRLASLRRLEGVEALAKKLAEAAKIQEILLRIRTDLKGGIHDLVWEIANPKNLPAEVLRRYTLDPSMFYLGIGKGPWALDLVEDKAFRDDWEEINSQQDDSDVVSQPPGHEYRIKIPKGISALTLKFFLSNPQGWTGWKASGKEYITNIEIPTATSLIVYQAPKDQSSETKTAVAERSETRSGSEQKLGVWQSLSQDETVSLHVPALDNVIQIKVSNRLFEIGRDRVTRGVSLTEIRGDAEKYVGRFFDEGGGEDLSETRIIFLDDQGNSHFKKALDPKLKNPQRLAAIELKTGREENILTVRPLSAEGLRYFAPVNYVTPMYSFPGRMNAVFPVVQALIASLAAQRPADSGPLQVVDVGVADGEVSREQADAIRAMTQAGLLKVQYRGVDQWDPDYVLDFPEHWRALFKQQKNGIEKINLHVYARDTTFPFEEDYSEIVRLKLGQAAGLSASAEEKINRLVSVTTLIERPFKQIEERFRSDSNFSFSLGQGDFSNHLGGLGLSSVDLMTIYNVSRYYGKNFQQILDERLSPLMNEGGLILDGFHNETVGDVELDLYKKRDGKLVHMNSYSLVGMSPIQPIFITESHRETLWRLARGRANPLIAEALSSMKTEEIPNSNEPGTINAFRENIANAVRRLPRFSEKYEQASVVGEFIVFDLLPLKQRNASERSSTSSEQIDGRSETRQDKSSNSWDSIEGKLITVIPDVHYVRRTTASVLQRYLILQFDSTKKRRRRVLILKTGSGKWAAVQMSAEEQTQLEGRIFPQEFPFTQKAESPAPFLDLSKPEDQAQARPFFTEMLKFPAAVFELNLNREFWQALLDLAAPEIKDVPLVLETNLGTMSAENRKRLVRELSAALLVKVIHKQRKALLESPLDKESLRPFFEKKIKEAVGYDLSAGWSEWSEFTDQVISESSRQFRLRLKPNAKDIYGRAIVKGRVPREPHSKNQKFSESREMPGGDREEEAAPGEYPPYKIKKSPPSRSEARENVHDSELRSSDNAVERIQEQIVLKGNQVRIRNTKGEVFDFYISENRRDDGNDYFALKTNNSSSSAMAYIYTRPERGDSLLRGIWLAPDLRGKGLLPAILNLFFYCKPEIPGTHPEMGNLKVLSYLEANYGFHPFSPKAAKAVFYRELSKGDRRNGTAVYEVYFSRDADRQRFVGGATGLFLSQFRIVSQREFLTMQSSMIPVYFGESLRLNPANSSFLNMMASRYPIQDDSDYSEEDTYSVRSEARILNMKRNSDRGDAMRVIRSAALALVPGKVSLDSRLEPFPAGALAELYREDPKKVEAGLRAAGAVFSFNDIFERPKRSGDQSEVTNAVPVLIVFPEKNLPESFAEGILDAFQENRDSLKHVFIDGRAPSGFKDRLKALGLKFYPQKVYQKPGADIPEETRVASLAFEVKGKADFAYEFLQLSDLAGLDSETLEELGRQTGRNLIALGRLLNRNKHLKAQELKNQLADFWSRQSGNADGVFSIIAGSGGRDAVSLNASFAAHSLWDFSAQQLLASSA